MCIYMYIKYIMYVYVVHIKHYIIALDDSASVHHASENLAKTARRMSQSRYFSRLIG